MHRYYKGLAKVFEVDRESFDTVVEVLDASVVEDGMGGVRAVPFIEFFFIKSGNLVARKEWLLGFGALLRALELVKDPGEKNLAETVKDDEDRE